MERTFLVLALLVAFSVLGVWGHGRLMEPPSRASMWRVGFNTVKDYNDNEGFCGGFTRQWAQNGGKCGICGDPYDAPHPRAHELGGMYGTGEIVKTYTQGDVIEVKVDITANHKGHFEFKLCPIQFTEATQQELDKCLLPKADGSGDKIYINSSKMIHTALLKLPDNLTCDHCVLQWTYVAANNWGMCADGTGKVGCGPQEHFRACADVRISPRTGGLKGTTSSLSGGNPNTGGVYQPTQTNHNNVISGQSGKQPGDYISEGYGNTNNNYGPSKDQFGSSSGEGVKGGYIKYLNQMFTTESTINVEQQGIKGQNNINAGQGQFAWENFDYYTNTGGKQPQGQSQINGNTGTSSQGQINGYTGTSNQGQINGYTGTSSQGQINGYTATSGQSQSNGYTGTSGQGQINGYTGTYGQGQSSGFTGTSAQGQISTGISGQGQISTGISGQGQFNEYTGTFGQGQSSGYTGISGQGQSSGYTGTSGQGQSSVYTGTSGQGQSSGYTGTSGQGQSGGYTGTSGQGQSGGYTGTSGQGQFGVYTGTSGQGQVSTGTTGQNGYFQVNQVSSSGISSGGGTSTGQVGDNKPPKYVPAAGGSDTAIEQHEFEDDFGKPTTKRPQPTVTIAPVKQPYTHTVPPPQPPHPQPNSGPGARYGYCEPIGIWKTLPGMADWCVLNCIKATTKFCPPTHCKCH